MNFDEVQSKLSAYRDEQGSAQQRWQIRGHLKDCAECRQALERLEDLCALLTPSPPEVELSADFAQRVVEQARQNLASKNRISEKPTSEEKPSERPAHPRRGSGLVQRFATAAAVLIVGVGSGLWLSDPLWDDASTTTERAQAAVEPLDEAPPGSLPAAYPRIEELSAR